MIELSPAVLDHFVAPDGRSAVMVGDDVAVLSALGAVVLQSLGEGPRSLEALVTRVVEALGEPPPGFDAADLVADTVAALRDLGAVS